MLSSDIVAVSDLYRRREVSCVAARSGRMHG